MTNSKTTRKALLSSALALLMCVAMLIATTFAWFTDTASTAVNKIQSGKLDVALEMKNPAYTGAVDYTNDEWISAEGQTLKFLQKNADGSLTQSEDIFWEPGCTYELPELRVVNNGNLALKYKIIISGIQGSAKLNGAIEWTINDADINLQETKLAANTKGDAFTIKGHMKEDAGNEYQGLSIDGIGITVIATQDTVEFDSTEKDYDEDAEYPVYVVEDVEVTAENKVKTSVTVKTEETLDDSTTPLAQATIPTNVQMEADTTQVALSITDNAAVAVGTEVGENQASKSFEIKLEGVSEENETEIEVVFYTEKNLGNVKIYHNGEAMTNDKYTYDSDTGKVTIKSKTFSPFDLVYDANVKEAASEAGLVTALQNAKAGDTIKLTESITIDAENYNVNKRLYVSTNDITIDLNENTLTAANCALTITGSNVTLTNGNMKVTQLTQWNSYVAQICGKNVVVDGVTADGGFNVSGANSANAEPDATVTITNCNITGKYYYTVCAQDNSAVTITNTTLTKGKNAFFWIEKEQYSENDEPSSVASKISYQESSVTFENGNIQTDGVLYNKVGVAPVAY